MGFACLHFDKPLLGFIASLVVFLNAAFDHLNIIAEFREVGSGLIGSRLYSISCKNCVDLVQQYVQYSYVVGSAGKHVYLQQSSLGKIDVNRRVSRR